MMFFAKVRLAATLLVAAAVASGAGALAFRSDAAEPQHAAPAPPRAPLAQAAPAVAQPPAAAQAPAARTANFMVFGTSPRVAQVIGEAAERCREELARKWLGAPMPPWPEKCPIEVKITLGGGQSRGGGATTFDFHEGKVRRQRMELQGPLDAILTCHLPHEVTHTVLAHALGRPVPRWADEGAAQLAEEDNEYLRLEKKYLSEIRAAGDYIPLRRLLPAREYLEPVRATYIQGASVTAFLVARKDAPTFVRFLKRAGDDGWDKALSDHYGFKDIDELEKAWLADVAPKGQVPPLSPLYPNGASPLVGAALVHDTADGGRALTLVYVTTNYAPIPSLQYVALGDVTVYSTDGQSVAAEKIPVLLRHARPVLISADNRPVDPYYLQVVKEGTLALVLKGQRRVGQSEALDPTVAPRTPVRPPPLAKESAKP